MNERRIALTISVVLITFALFGVVPAAQTQVRLAANNQSFSQVTMTPTGSPNTINDSPEIFAMDVPPANTSGFLLFNSNAGWEVDYGAASPLEADFSLRYNVTGAALPSGVVLAFGTQLTRFSRANNAAGSGYDGGTVTDSAMLTREIFATLLLAHNPALSVSSAAAIADNLFALGFHVSVIARLRSQNVSSAVVIWPNVAIFSQPGSVSKH